MSSSFVLCTQTIAPYCCVVNDLLDVASSAAGRPAPSCNPLTSCDVRRSRARLRERECVADFLRLSVSPDRQAGRVVYRGVRHAIRTHAGHHTEPLRAGGLFFGSVTSRHEGTT